MRLAWIIVLMSVAAGFSHAAAQENCVAASVTYSSGAAICQPAVSDGQLVQQLFSCEAGVWTDTGTACPNDFAYFCRIGPHAISVGERFLLGAGPAFLECRFPGVFVLNQDAAPVASGAQPSALVRRVQLFLSEDSDTLDCSENRCAGQVDRPTLLAVAAYIRDNFERLSAEERDAFGFASAADVEAGVLAQSPLDVIPVFAKVFDVPNS